MKVKLYGMAKEALGQATLSLENTADIRSVKDLKERLRRDYPAFSQLPPVGIAVNMEYARDTDLVNEQDELVVIPPVSGG